LVPLSREDESECHEGATKDPGRLPEEVDGPTPSKNRLVAAATERAGETASASGLHEHDDDEEEANDYEQDEQKAIHAGLNLQIA
jgi:hypothetical protein